MLFSKPGGGVCQRIYLSVCRCACMGMCVAEAKGLVRVQGCIGFKPYLYLYSCSNGSDSPKSLGSAVCLNRDRGVVG